MGKKVRLRKDEGGYALALVLILLILVGLIIGPLLLLMTTSLMSAYRHEEGMLGFYAADAGIEDAAYKIRNEDGNLPEYGDDPWEYPDYPAIYLNDSEVHVAIQRVSSDDPDDEVYRITSTATSDGGSTTVESYVKADRVDLSGFGDNAITTNGTVTIMPGSTVDGTIETDPEYWPTAEHLAAYFWEDVEDETPFAYDFIDVDDTPSIGPLYRDGHLDIYNGGTAGVMATLNGTVYITGDLDIGKTNQDFTLDLNGQTIFVEGEIDIGGKCTITGSGCIIAVGAVTFQPNISSEEGDFVFLMSVEGTVTFQPNGDYYGSVAGNVEVTLQPGSSLTLVDPEGAGFEFPSGGVAELDIRTYTIQ